MNDLHLKALPQPTLSLLEKITHHPFPELEQFYLSGGTALSLHYGHRESEDLDFFAFESFDPESLLPALKPFGKVSDTVIETGTLNTYIDGVKVQFLHYPYPLLENLQEWQGLRLSHPLDIACTKIQTIAARGSKKDFLDLWELLKHYTLQEILDKMQIKYQSVDYNLPHILKSLVYFADADQQPTPRLHYALEWEQVKNDLIAQIKTIHLSSNH